MTRNLILILGDQLNLDSPALEGFDARHDHILMVECAGEATHVWSHKARIVLFLSAMRHFYARLSSQYTCGLQGMYLKLGEHDFATLSAAWTHTIAALKPQKLIICEPGEYRLEQDLNTCPASRIYVDLQGEHKNAALQTKITQYVPCGSTQIGRAHV